MNLRSSSLLLLGCYLTLASARVANLAAPANETCNAKISRLGLKQLGARYYFFSDEDNQLTWGKSRQFCRAQGLDLAGLETLAEHELLAVHARHSGLAWTDFWLGGTDVDHEGRWIWTGSGEAFSFNAWGPGQPNNNGGHEHCVQAWMKDGEASWFDYNCDNEERFICEMKGPCPVSH